MHRQKTARAHLPTAGNRRTRRASARQQTEGSLMAGTNTIKQQAAGAGATGAGQAKAALQVFAGGACYGAMATTYKLAYAAGFTSAQVVASQAWFGCLFFALATLAGHALGHRWQRVGWKLALKLMGLGALTCLTSILYCYAMSVLPAPVALTLLFQFTWLGLVWQTVMTRRPPRLLQVASALVIVFGTVFASGVYKTGITGYDPVALLCALGAAVSCSLFVTLSGKVEAPLLVRAAWRHRMRGLRGHVAHSVPGLRRLGRPRPGHPTLCRHRRLLWHALPGPALRHGLSAPACGPLHCHGRRGTPRRPAHRHDRPRRAARRRRVAGRRHHPRWRVPGTGSLPGRRQEGTSRRRRTSRQLVTPSQAARAHQGKGHGPGA